MLTITLMGLFWACTDGDEVQARGPLIELIEPLSGTVDTKVRIEGSGFEKPLTVKIGLRDMVVESASATEISAIVPIGATTGEISVTSNELRATGETFTVTKAPLGELISLDCASITTLNVNEQTSLTALTNPVGASVNWSSSNTEVATVENGVVTGVAAGEATITATSGSVSYTCDIVVVDGPVLSFVVTPDAVQLYRGETAQLTISDIMVEEGYSLADLEDATFASDNEDVATVSDTGLITAEGVGETMVTVGLANKNVKVSALVKEDIYVAGQYGYKAVYWKNNVETILPSDNDAQVNVIKVDDMGNVYSLGTDGTDKAVLWINETKVELIEGNISNHNMQLIQKPLEGGVFVIINEKPDDYIYKVYNIDLGGIILWESPEDILGLANSMSADFTNGHLYVGGNKQSGLEADLKIWKINADNGSVDDETLLLPSKSNDITALSGIEIDHMGNLQLVGTWQNVDTDEFTISQWTMNTNLEIIQSEDLTESASHLILSNPLPSLVVDDQNNYVLAKEDGNIPVIWKNGVATSLFPNEPTYYPASIDTKDGIIYVCGAQNDDTFVVWKIQENGEYELIEVKNGIDTEEDYINSIYVR